MMQEYEIDGVIVDREVLTTRFACDISKCHGGCCYSPDDAVVGPPLTQAEATYVRHHKEMLAVSIPSDGWHNPSVRRGIAIRQPLGTYKRKPPFRIRLHDYSCIYCTAKGCLLKDLHRKGEITIDEPLSCSLYPIVEGTDAAGVAPFIYVEHYYDSRYCLWGYKRGKEEGIYLLDFLREPLVRRFGKEFFEHLKQLQDDILG